jgi:hypothetical protein
MVELSGVEVGKSRREGCYKVRCSLLQAIARLLLYYIL